MTYLRWGIVFLGLNIEIGRVDILPDFVGVLLLLKSLQSHSVQTETEERLRPLLFVLAADFFAHWITDFQNGAENLLILIISLYTVFVFIGEVAERIRPQQPDVADSLDRARRWIVALQTAAFTVSAYDNNVINVAVVMVMLILWIVFIVMLCGIRPLEEAVNP